MRSARSAEVSPALHRVITRGAYLLRVSISRPATDLQSVRNASGHVGSSGPGTRSWLDQDSPKYLTLNAPLARPTHPWDGPVPFLRVFLDDLRRQARCMLERRQSLHIDRSCQSPAIGEIQWFACLVVLR